MTQQVVADLLGLTLRTYQRYENGETEPTLHHLIALAIIYDITVDQLLGLTCLLSHPDCQSGESGFCAGCKSCEFWGDFECRVCQSDSVLCAPPDALRQELAFLVGRVDELDFAVRESVGRLRAFCDDPPSPSDDDAMKLSL